ncbi:MAG TPA: response regulator [Aggregatilineales bacterium]|nr:response regulator [Anaerolineales bacterium]HRE46110.1 response regulator [Aggregatilineales bacterium]
MTEGAVSLPPNFLAGWIVVVIDDEDDSLGVIQHLLTYYGAEVHPATNGQEGFAAVLRVRPRFVICDLSMPVMDGWEFMITMQNTPRTMHIPVIALTAHAMMRDRERAIQAGFYNYLTKPFTVKTFIHDLLAILTTVPELAALLPEGL